MTKPNKPCTHNHRAYISDQFSFDFSVQFSLFILGQQPMVIRESDVQKYTRLLMILRNCLIGLQFVSVFLHAF